VGASVLVVGAGVAGLSLGRALTLQGIDCTVVERRTSTDNLGMGLNLPGNAARALTRLGLFEEAIAHAALVTRREYRNSRGRLLFGTDDADFWAGIGTPICLRHGHLLAALRIPPAAPVRHGVQVLSAHTAGAHVEVQLAGMTSTTYDLVVGADGVHSILRTAIAGDDAVLRRSAMTGSSWRFVVANPGVDCWTVWSGAAATLLLIPVGDGDVYGYASSTRGGATGDDAGWLAETLAGFARPAGDVIAALLSGGGQLHHSLVEEVRLPTWHRDRLVVIGDAAHATGPVWAQGAAMAMEDALVLAEVLAVTSDWSEVGEAFERARRARVDHVQTVTDKMSRLAGLPTWLRDLGAPVLGPRAFRAAYGPLRVDPFPIR